MGRVPKKICVTVGVAFFLLFSLGTGIFSFARFSIGTLSNHMVIEQECDTLVYGTVGRLVLSVAGCVSYRFGDEGLHPREGGVYGVCDVELQRSCIKTFASPSFLAKALARDSA